MAAEDSNVADLVTAAARRRPDDTALIDAETGAALTWRAADRAIDDLVNRITEFAVADGDRVALRLPTSARFAIAFFAILRAGAIAVPLNPQAPAGEIEPLLEDSGARLLIADRTDEPTGGIDVLVPTVPPDAAADTRNPDIGRTAAGSGESTRGAAAGEAAAGTGGVDTDAGVPAASGGETIAAIFYTSAAAGPARGVLLSHRALLANVTQLHTLDPPATRPTDRVFVAIPLHHIYGLGPGLLSTVAAGATTILSARFEVGKALAELADHRVTTLIGVPAMYTALAEQPTARLAENLAALRLMVSGAAPLHPRVLATIRAATGLGVYEGYGLTEAAPVVTSTLVTGYPKPGSVGRPLPGVEVRLVDSDGHPLPVPLDPDDALDTDVEAEDTGLVAVRGANLFSGYWPDGANGPDADGWFSTPDVGYLDVDGDLHLVDRTNDLIIVNGFNVYPHEIEEVIEEISGVDEVAVVGTLDKRTGEAVKAVVVRAPGSALSEQQVFEWCGQRLAGYKVPRTVEFVPELPHSPLGKLRRADLRARR